MYTFNLDDVQLDEVPDGSIRVDFPLQSVHGVASFSAVLFEVDPGNALATHTDSAEELLLVLAGEGEAHVHGETLQVRAGDVAVVPALAPHGVRNTGGETLRVIGLFSSSTVMSIFEQGIGPAGEQLISWGAGQPLFGSIERPALATA